MSAPSQAPGWGCTSSTRSSGSTEAGSRSRARKARAPALPCSCLWTVRPGQRSAAVHRILCVEDDQETSSLLAEALTELGYIIETACDGKSGLAKILAQRPDLVLCDVRMPRMGGFELLEKVTAAGPAFARVPFVFLTALDDRENVLAGRRLGADDYLTKPVDFELLGVVVDNRLR